MSVESPRRLLILSCSDRKNDVAPDHEITYYDLKMTPELAARQREANVSRLKETMGRHGYREIFLMLGRTYLEALGPMSDWSGGCRVIHEPADIDVMLGRLKAWLRA